MSSDHEMRAMSMIDAIRLRPGMYVGGIDQRALHQLIETILQNRICYEQFGRLRGIDVTILDGGFMRLHLEDDGLPIDRAADGTTSRLEMLMTQMQSIEDVAYITLNVLSSDLTVTAKRDGYEWQQQYRAGVKTTELTQLRPLAANEAQGTTFLFKPDASIFKETEFNEDILTARLREISYLIAGLPITLNIEQAGREYQYTRFYSPRGLLDMLRDVMPTHASIADKYHRPIHAKIVTEADPADIPRDRFGAWTPLKQIIFEVAIQFRSTQQAQFAYCNMRLNSEGGTHLDALRDGIVNAINQQAPQFGIRKLGKHSILSHTLAVTSIFIPDPKFANATISILGSPEVREPILQLTTQAINDFASKYTDQMSNFLRDLDWRRHQDRDEKMERREKHSHSKSAN